MCGLTGFCDFNKRLGKNELNRAIGKLAHRGPDGEGTEVYTTDHVHIGLAHRRLSILDLSTAACQPMKNESESISLMLNGEVYNFQEIKEELISLGHTFRTSSDTEVVLKGYEQWGMDVLEKLAGMFVLIILDKPKSKLYLIRDRAGVKPLYVYQKNNTILFASELKAFHEFPSFDKDVQPEAVGLFFKYGYIPAPYTIFKNTQKVMPGHYHVIDIITGGQEEVCYYDVIDSYNKPKLRIDEKEAQDEVEKLMITSFNYRMVSDVPVGIFLSGGYDSTSVTAMLQSQSHQQLKTFTIGFKEEIFNEADDAKKIANYLGTDHYEYYCTTRESQEILPLLPDIYDEPFGDSSAIPTTLVSRFARKHVTVALSADGGDEIFAGYNRYTQLVNLTKKVNIVPSFLRQPIAQMSALSANVISSHKTHRKASRISDVLTSDTIPEFSDAITWHYSRHQLEKLLPGRIKIPGLYDHIKKLNGHNDLINTSLALDFKTYMVDDILVKVDRATMSCGLEGREPFLDHRLVDFVAQLPSELKFHNGEKKYLLKNIVHKYVPKEIMDRPKKGFGIPLFNWLQGDLKNFLFEYINEKEINKHGLLDAHEAIRIRDRFLKGDKETETQVWLLLMFQLWWRRWMD